MPPFLPLLWLAAAPACAADADGAVATTLHNHAARDLRLDVEDGAALLTLSDRLRPEGAGVALSSYSIALPESRGVVVDAWLASRHGTVASKILGPEDAQSEFEAFEVALRYGSMPDEDERKRRGRPQAALLVRHVYEGVEVQVAAPCGLGDVDVHLRIRLASDPLDDQWRFELPSTIDVRVRSIAVPGRTWRRLDDNALVIERSADEVRGRIATVRLLGEPERHALRAELDLPRRLREEQPLAFVFVLDRSVSFGADRLVASTRLLEGMLAIAPAGSSYAVVSVERYPRVVVSPGTPADDTAPLQKLAADVQLYNGSDVMSALELAKRVAADAGEREGRVLLVSDLETAATVDEAQLFVKLAAGQSLTHVLKVAGEGTRWWWRTFAEDGSLLAAGAEASGGVFVEGSLLLEQPDLELAAYLVRPTRLERPRIVATRGAEVIVDSDGAGDLIGADQRGPWLVVEGATVTDGTNDVLPDELAEGAGLRVTGIVHPLVPVAELSWHAEGSLWATRARYRLSSAPATAQLLPAVAAVNGVSDVLDDSAVWALSEESQAVSRVASRLALPSWRPPPRNNAFGYGCSCGGGSLSSRGIGCTSCRCAGFTQMIPYDRAGEIERWLEASRDRCGSSGEHMRIEYRSQEILDVSPQERFGPVERCYREALYGLRLDENPAVTAAAYGAAGDVIVRLPE